MEKIIAVLKQYAIEFGPPFLLAILTLIIGLWIIGRMTRMLKKVMDRKDVDPSLKPFLGSIFSVSLKVLLIISVASMVGIATTSFIAVLGAAGLAVGLALQGSLSNFAGGVLILLLKPFKVGDYVAAGGHSGTVDRIHVFYTYLRTPQNQIIVIPNGGLANGSVINYTAEEPRRLDQTYGIAYSDDIDKTRSVLKELIDNDERILREPEPQILLDSLGDSSVNMKIRVWANLDDFWSLHFDMQEKVKKAFDKEDITIPFPQRDVHMHGKNGGAV